MNLRFWILSFLFTSMNIYADCESLLKTDDFLAALTRAGQDLDLTVKAITQNSDASLEAVIMPLEKFFLRFDRLQSFWRWQVTSNSTPTVKQLQQQFRSQTVKLMNTYFHNAELFLKIRNLHNRRHSFSTAQLRLIEFHYALFVNRGALLGDDVRGRFDQIQLEVALLSMQFLTNIKSAQAALHWENTDIEEILTFSENEDERKRVDFLQQKIAAPGTAFDNSFIAQKIAQLRAELAELLGYSTYADLALSKELAKTKLDVQTFYRRQIAVLRPQAEREEQHLRDFVLAHTGSDQIAHWNRKYFIRRLKEVELGIDFQKLKSYFTLKDCLAVIFEILEQRHGMTFFPRVDLPKPHPDVEVYEVKNRQGQVLSIFYLDLFARPGSKKTGAWVSQISAAEVFADKIRKPSYLSLSTNLKPSINGAPVFLTLGNVKTQFHEFGHALNIILSEAQYPSQFGVRIPRDLVELASLLMERLAMTPAILRKLARHPETGQPLSDSEIDKIITAENMFSATKKLNSVGLGLLDLAWHTSDFPDEFETLVAYEQRILSPVLLNPKQKSPVRSTCFTHIFSGLYGSLYHSYSWCECLADRVFPIFEKNPVKFAKKIFAPGNSVDPADAVESLFTDSHEHESSGTDRRHGEPHPQIAM